MKTEQRHYRQAGFSMVEVLVTLVVLALGLLGMAGLQSYSIKSTHSAYLRTQANLYAHDILDRMRANREAARAGQYNLAMDAPAPTCNRSAYDMEDCDRAEWRADLASLPEGKGSITYNASSQLITVIVQWNDARAGGANPATLTIQSQL